MDLNDHVLSDCDDTHLRTGDTSTGGCTRAVYLVSETPSKRSLARWMVLCQERGLSASCEPQVCGDLSLGSSVASDSDWTSNSNTWIVSFASG